MLLEYTKYSFPSKNIEFIFADPKYEVCKNRHELAKFIEGYNIYEIIPIGKTEKGNKKEVLEELKKIILKKYPAHAMSLGFAIEGLEDNINLCETVLDKNQFELKPLDKIPTLGQFEYWHYKKRNIKEALRISEGFFCVSISPWFLLQWDDRRTYR